MKELNVALIYKLNLERSLKRSLKQIIFWCKFFGVNPINLNFSTTVDETSRNIFSYCNVKTKCIFIAHLMWSVLILTSIAVSVYYERSFDERDSVSFILKCLYMGEYLLNIFNCTLIVIGCHYQSRSYVKYFNKIIDIDMKFRECGVAIDYGNLQKYLKNFCKFSAMFMMLATVSDLLYYFSVKDFIRSATVFILSNLLVIATFIEYFGLLYVIKERYKSICSALNQLLVQSDEFPKKNSMEKHAAWSTVDLMKINRNAYVDLTTVMVKRLTMLRRIHYDLSMFNEELNSSFGILIISTLMTTFIVVSTQMYAFYDIAKSFSGVSNIYLAIYSGLWFIFHSSKTFLILLLNHHVYVEKYNIGPLLYKLNLHTYKDYRKIETSVSEFSMQILHLKRYQATTGILNLDLTLLTTIVGSLTTYFVILVQFGDYV